MRAQRHDTWLNTPVSRALCSRGHTRGACNGRALHNAAAAGERAPEARSITACFLRAWRSFASFAFALSSAAPFAALLGPVSTLLLAWRRRVVRLPRGSATAGRRCVSRCISIGCTVVWLRWRRQGRDGPRVPRSRNGDIICNQLGRRRARSACNVVSRTQQTQKAKKQTQNAKHLVLGTLCARSRYH